MTTAEDIKECNCCSCVTVKIAIAVNVHKKGAYHPAR